MKPRPFQERLTQTLQQAAPLCLDVDPDDPVAALEQQTIAVAAYTLNHRAAALDVVVATIALIRQTAPHALIIADQAPTDIPDTSRVYARTVLHDLGFDAAVINPWGGTDTIEPWLEDPAKFAFIDCLPPDPQSIAHCWILAGPGKLPGKLYEHAVRMTRRLGRHNTGIHGHPTNAQELRKLSSATGAMPLMIDLRPSHHQTVEHSHTRRITRQRKSPTLWRVDDPLRSTGLTERKPCPTAR